MLRIAIFQQTVEFVKKNKGINVDDAISKFTHDSIIKQVVGIEISAIIELVASGKPMGHKYWDYWEESPNYVEFKVDYKEALEDKMNKFKYVKDDPGLLLSLDNESLSIFRFILSGITEVKILEELDILPKDDAEKEVLFKQLSETWLLLYVVEDYRNNIFKGGDLFDSLADIIEYFMFDNDEIKYIVESIKLDEMLTQRG